MKLYAWGANSASQLGLGTETEQEVIPVLVDFPRPIEQIVDLQPGSNFCLALDSSGVLYGTGAITPSIQFKQFTKINHLFAEKIQAISSGWNFSLFLTSSNILYGLGSNKYKQIDPESKAVSFDTITKTKTSSRQQVRRIYCGLRETALVYHDGTVQLFGKSFNEICNTLHVKKVAFGESHCLLSTRNGEVFGKGCNKFGQLNRPESKKINFWSKLDFFTPITDIFSGWYHSVFVTENGVVYCCGRNTYGQLGCGVCTDFQSDLRIVEDVKCSNFASGAQHNLLIDDNAQLWSWGWNEHGSCGNGSVADCFRPSSVLSDVKFSKIFANYGQSFAITT